MSYSKPQYEHRCSRRHHKSSACCRSIPVRPARAAPAHHTRASSAHPTALLAPRSFARSVYFLSSSILHKAVDALEAEYEATAGTIQHASTVAQAHWDSVLIGAVLALETRSDMLPLTAVHVGAAFSEGWAGRSGGMQSTTLVWTAGGASDNLVPAMMMMDRWARRHHCNGSVSFTCQKRYTSCSHAKWRRCVSKQGTNLCDRGARPRAVAADLRALAMQVAS